jgi:DNA-binding response OmpR family regulator
VNKSKNILIAEDEKAYCRALVLKLQKAGFNAEGVGNGQEALDQLKSKKFDLLILDLIMPQVSGFEVLEEMKKLEIKVPAVVLSNLTQSEDKERVIALDVKDFIEKADTSIVDVVNRVEKLLQ